MSFLFNDLSLHGQFADAAAFRIAVGKVMKIRAIAQRFGHEVDCHRGLNQAQVTESKSLAQYVSELEIEERRAFLAWINKTGPFWDDTRVHGENEVFACGENPVTNSAVGEAAASQFEGVSKRLVSVDPSQWTRSPIEVTWHLDDGSTRSAGVPNHWESEGLAEALAAGESPIRSWQTLDARARNRFTDLTFLEDAFKKLYPHPFYMPACERILILLNALNTLKTSFRADGTWNEKGKAILQDYFSGSEARFTDSSAGDKAKYGADMKFPHPTIPREYLDCTWHGKVKTPQIRIHFTFPITEAAPLYIAYVGPKITKW